MNEILFYDPKEKPYGAFSNFYRSQITLSDMTYNDSESYYQSEKFKGRYSTVSDTEYANLIKDQSTAGKSKILAVQNPKKLPPYKWAQLLKPLIIDSISNGVKIRNDWEEVKDHVMRRAVYLKFSQNLELKKVLISTLDKKLVEHTFRDSYWGDGYTETKAGPGLGKNMLGKILEETRYLMTGSLSPRYNSMLIYDKSHWIIPGLLLASAAPNKEIFESLLNVGFECFISLMTYEREKKKSKFLYHNIDSPGDTCKISDNVILSRYSIDNVESDDKIIEIVLIVLKTLLLEKVKFPLYYIVGEEKVEQE